MEKLSELFKDFIIKYAKEKAKEDIECGRTRIDNVSELMEELEDDFYSDIVVGLRKYKILYHDYYCEEYNLPKRVEILASDLEVDDDLLSIDSDELEDMIVDYLSDNYGYCLEDYTYNIEDNKVIVFDIVWDIME